MRYLLVLILLLSATAMGADWPPTGGAPLAPDTYWAHSGAAPLNGDINRFPLQPGHTQADFDLFIDIWEDDLADCILVGGAGGQIAACHYTDATHDWHWSANVTGN